MRSYLSIAYKELRVQKIMAGLILTAIILSSIMTTAIGQSLGILETMRIHQAASLNGDRYVTFHQITEEQARKLAKDSRLFEVGSLINVGSVKLGNSGLSLFLREYSDHALDAYPMINKIKEGRLPTSPLEVALPENALDYLGKEIKIDDTISLQAEISLMDGTVPAYAYSADLTVCGILEGNYIGYSSGILDAVAGEGTALALLPREYLLYSTNFKVKDTAKLQAVVDELAGEFQLPEKNIQYNWILLDALGISYRESGASDTDTGFSFMTFSCVMVGALVLLAAGLVIYNILKISVAKRIREFGTLRAIGGERGQIYRIVSLELLILCGMGIPVGLLIGAFSAKGILIAATGILNPDLFLASSTAKLQEMIRGAGSDSIPFYFVSVAVTVLFAMLAAFPAARYASRVSPTVAMSGQTVKIKRHIRRAKRIRHFEAWYARLNLKRGGGRTAITILSLVMSITVFVALQSFTAVLDASRSVKDLNLGDYAVTNESTGIDPESVDKIRQNELVEQLATTKLSTYLQDENGEIPLDTDISLQSWEALHIAGVDDARLTSYVDELSEQDLADLRSGKACMIKNPIPFSYEGQEVIATNFQYNDIIDVNGHELRVAGISNASITINNEAFVNGVQIIVNDDIYRELTGIDRYSEVYPTLRENADAEQFEEWLENWSGENPGAHWLSYQQTASQLEESFEQIHMLCWGLILFIGLIGILNIINTVYSNLHTRISEIGMQRAIGMSKGSLYQTFLWEGAYYGILASVFGGAAGYLCTIFVNAAITDQLELVGIPFLPILEAAAVSILACLLATAIPLRSIAKMEIVTSIETGE